ncbi:MAG: puromycin-sensitive aminopeptidase [Actinomycetota bacterium]|nr:puromycin-sensitive aminopeptidase [Actinomycetota bacterium]
MPEDSEARYRLPRSVIPQHYAMTVEPDLDAASFSGTQEVRIQVLEPITEIVLNALGLDLQDGSLTAADGTQVEIAKIRMDPEAERAHLELQSAAAAGDWTLSVRFEGEFNRQLTGFYLSTYRDSAGVEQRIGTTHFEATDARRAFPCWDEPDLKAPWGITLVVAQGLTAISNGPEVSREGSGDGRVRIRFADTMPMSSYLVAFVVGPLELTQSSDANGTPVRIAHVPGKGALTRFSQDVGVRSLNFFGDYYGIPYPDAKVDHIALPDFAQGAMENLGCITYRETYLLIDPETATQQELMDAAETVAHELAHMWFGDLVTMRWWNGIWLNEAFATFMSMLAVDDMYPEWEIWTLFARQRVNALEVDALESTRPIEYPVHSPDDASGMFDTLTYTKGGAVLRMLEQYLGRDRFRDGIRRYLRTHAHANTETHDLWDALEEETGEPVRRIMDAWIFQGGYPQVTVTQSGGVAQLTQARYRADGLSSETTWPLPLAVRQGTDVRWILLEAEGAEVPLTGDGPLVINADGASFARVWYADAELRERLASSAMTELSPIERQGFVDDAWAAVVGGLASAVDFIELVQGFKDETELTVWQAIITGLGWCDRFMDGAARDRFRDTVRELVRPAVERLGWEPAEGESDLTRTLRGTLIQTLAITGDDPEAQAQARELEHEARAGERVDAALAAAAVEIVAATGGPEDYATYRSMANEASTPQEQQRYLSALARFRDDALMDRTLSSSLTEEVRSQDGPFILGRAITNRDQGHRVWRFLAGHWDDAKERFAASNMIYLASGVRYITDPDLAEEIQAFFEAHPIPQAALTLQQILERQRIAVALRVRAGAELAARFGA